MVLSSQFQSTHPRGVRPIAPWVIEQPPAFQSTHPRGVRLYLAHFFHLPNLFQSTHPRGVRRREEYVYRDDKGFNPRTHAGCDVHLGDYEGKLLNVSIHAPTRGATQPPQLQSTPDACFNPRTHAGCDYNAIIISLFDAVSIHAPTRGATHSSFSTPEAAEFQSTHPRGVRP